MTPSVPFATAAAATPAPRRRAVPKWVYALPLVLSALALATWWWRPWAPRASGPVSGQFFPVVPMDMEIKIVKDGELQAVDYTDVKSEVEGLTQIIEIVKEGTTVQKNDVLVVLDSSQLQLRKDEADQAVIKAESALKIAKELKEIQENQNATNKEAAEVAVQLATIDLKQYEEGTYPQSLTNAKTALEMALITQKNNEEDYEQVKALAAKGFVTGTDVKKSELSRTTARNEVAKAQTALDVLQKYTHLMEITRLKSAKLQAEQRLFRVQRENRALLNQRLIDVQEKEATLEEAQKRATKLQEQLAACTIKAQDDGLVIYASTIDRNQREPVQEGTQVRQSQWLLRLPDIKRMKAVLKIQESQKTKLDDKKNLRASVRIIGHSRPIGATLDKVSVLPDSGSRWWNPDLREYPVELLLDETPPGVKPGMRVELAEIFISRHEQVLAVPLAALYAVGRDNYVFVKSGDTVKERKVVLGVTNETHVQVTDGLEDGDEVLLLTPGQGRALLEKAGIKVTDPTTRPSRNGKRNRDGGDRNNPAGGRPVPAQQHDNGAQAVVPTTQPVAKTE